MDRLKDGLDGEHTTVTIRLQKEIDKYQVSMCLNIYQVRVTDMCIHMYVRMYVRT